MKGILAGLLVLCAGLQYQLWFDEGNIRQAWQLRDKAKELRADVLRLGQRNQALAAEVTDLKSGLEAVEERARADLGMISEGETFYQFVQPHSRTSP